MTKPSEVRNSINHGDAAYVQWSRILLIILGLVFLIGPLHAVQRIGKMSFIDVNDSLFAENWTAWIFISFIALGWIFAHGFEISILRERNHQPLFWIVTFLIVSTFIALYLEFISTNAVLNHFGATAQSLLFSGATLRQATFHHETFRRFASIFGRWNQSSTQ